MNTVNCCWNCKFHIEGSEDCFEYCPACQKGEVFCELLKDKYGESQQVEPNNICDKWRAE